MKISIIGTGYVGLTTALCFADSGHQVLCIDKDLSKINSLKNSTPTIYEDSLQDLLNKTLKAKTIEFSSDLEYGIKNSEVIILAVGTPQNDQTGEADLSHIYSASVESAKFIKEYKIFITKSTVPVGTNFEIKKIIEKNSGVKIDVVSNPEFMREGFAIKDFMEPDRIIVGIENENSHKIMRELYSPWIKKNYPILFTDILTAELIKYASNAFLMTKVAFINEIESLATKMGANIKDLTSGIGLDNRIGKAFLNPGPGVGGSCFPKDSMALKFIAEKNHENLSILNQVIESNFLRFQKMAKKINDKIKNDLPDKSSKEIAILGLAFKAGTDDVRMSPAIEIIKYLLADNFKIYAFDPKAIENSKKILGDKIVYCSSLEECFNKCRNIAILTEWPEFKNIVNFDNFKDKNIIDLRYIL
ncbi:MAG: UDP-glucose/GDP-mannose dehydrogenase family protein [Proteobacteria bacterium]|nr:UDP-glucose/GDP-mannose dehydrogenase family protein [Pseudomonadota bacterium]NCA28779.1 UDP-glucose/GDP-mannose dehydrogenase family protein [Pseudomonadota bacterium]